jgi:diguanylate cyclase (GGDEF)-like protein
MGKPIGYVCYFFKDYDITMYTKTASISNALSLGIGGYVDSKYQEKLSEQIAEMYKKDNLTGLYNRIGFKEVFTNIINDADNTNSKITLIMSDLDGLKYINDTFGHAEGDNAIAVLASALKSSCPEHAICSRFGGDELFSVIIGEVDTNDIISKIDSYLDNYNQNSGLNYKVRSSSGYFTTTLTDKFNFNEALKLADSAMYKIKKSRK